MILTVQRFESKLETTLGHLLIDGLYFCDTLEDQIRELYGVPVADWKIPGETAIPQGRYKVTLENSPKFGSNTMTVNDVPGYEDIRIHAGNTDVDTHGCLLVGKINGETSVGDSRLNLAHLKMIVTTAINSGADVFIEYINPGQGA